MEPQTYGKFFEVDVDAVMREKCASGQGVIALQAGMDDVAILSVIKYAISISDGKAFVVIPASKP